jgi:UDP-N-acetylmuramate dehydrogenase
VNWERNIPLASRTWWKIGGEAEYFTEPSSLEELTESYLKALKQNIQVTVLGGGTNVLVSDLGIKGLVISMKKLNQVSSTTENNELIITAQAGAQKSELTKIFLRQKLDPALFLCGLPGDVGGGVVMNAGVSEKILPREFCEIIQSVDVLKPSGQRVTLQKDEISWTYRKSDGWQDGIIVSAKFSWPLKENPQVMQLVREATRSRLERQPLNMPSCGSTFKNPLPDKSAGFLIEQAGLKGFQIGGAQVSPKHANFIVNLKASDVDQLIKHVRKAVFEKFSIELETEVRYLGQWNL